MATKWVDVILNDQRRNVQKGILIKLTYSQLRSGGTWAVQTPRNAYNLIGYGLGGTFSFRGPAVRGSLTFYSDQQMGFVCHDINSGWFRRGQWGKLKLHRVRNTGYKNMGNHIWMVR